MPDTRSSRQPSPKAHDPAKYGRHKEPVYLNVYDLMKINEYTTPLGFGIFHSGVEVYGIEYAYVAQSSTESSIFEVTPRDAHQLGDEVQYRETIYMGHTYYTRPEVWAIIAELGQRFRGNHYHLTTNNCNHFSNALTRALVGRGIPGWVNRLAHIFSHVPLLGRRLPKEILRPVSVIQQQQQQSEVEVEEQQDFATSTSAEAVSDSKRTEEA